MLAEPYLVGSTLVLRSDTDGAKLIDTMGSIARMSSSSQARDLMKKNKADTADILVVLLSRQLLRNARILALITLAMKEGKHVFGVNADVGFSYPDEAVYNSLHGPDFEVQRRVWGTYGLNAEEVEDALRFLFLTIALPLHGAAGKLVLCIQVSGILKRIQVLRVGTLRGSLSVTRSIVRRTGVTVQPAGPAAARRNDDAAAQEPVDDWV